MGKALTAIILGSAAVATGLTLDSETGRNMVEYVLNPEHVEVMASYAGLAKLGGAISVAAGVLGKICTMGQRPTQNQNNQPYNTPS